MTLNQVRVRKGRIQVKVTQVSPCNDAYVFKTKNRQKKFDDPGNKKRNHSKTGQQNQAYYED